MYIITKLLIDQRNFWITFLETLFQFVVNFTFRSYLEMFVQSQSQMSVPSQRRITQMLIKPTNWWNLYLFLTKMVCQISHRWIRKNTTGGGGWSLNEEKFRLKKLSPPLGKSERLCKETEFWGPLKYNSTLSNLSQNLSGFLLDQNSWSCTFCLIKYSTIFRARGDLHKQIDPKTTTRNKNST